MAVNPIVNAKLLKYQRDFCLSGTVDEVFEKFANYHVMSQYQPGVFGSDLELMDCVTAGGGDDLGIDGICFFLNGQVVRSCEDIDELLTGNKRGGFELVFTQAKNKSKFDYGEFLKFTTGVKDFLKENIDKPHNESITKWHDVYNHIISNEIIIKWSENPSIRLFYIVNGPLEYAPNITVQCEATEAEIVDMCSFKDAKVELVDDKRLLSLIDYNENNYTFIIDIIDSMPLPEVEGVDNSRVVLCKASELVKMISTEEGSLRRNIFDDNVRDYQGDSTINTEIKYTVQNEAEKFVLLNNGITVVCSGITDANRKIKISNPQVVNGCQTCCVLYYSSCCGVNLDNTFVVAKFISTDDDEIVNNIVKGTNRQNIVYEEAFAITTEFHKSLEKYFSSVEIGGEKIYYERRSKQYESSQSITPLQKVNFRALIQSTVAIFLNRPEEAHRHESTLLNMYKNVLFKDGQSYCFYHVAAYLYLFIERMYRKKCLSRDLYTYKMQIMLVMKELMAEQSPEINRKKEIEKYCEKIISILDDSEKTSEIFQEAVKRFVSVSEAWIKEKGEQYRDARKDRKEFTEYLLASIRAQGEKEVEVRNIGRVICLKSDRNGMFYGFIQCLPENIYFSEYDNVGITLEYEGRNVSYDVKEYKNKLQAINVTLVD